jgi:DNA transformation protein
VSCLLTLVTAAVSLLLLDRVLVWCELRGWISYRLSPRPIRTAVGNTLLGIEELYRPSRRHVIELRQDVAVQREDDDDGSAGGTPHASNGRAGTLAALAAPSDGFVGFVLDRLAPLGAIASRPLYGGVGLYAHDGLFGILAGETLYLRVDDRDRARHDAAGLVRFTPFADRPGTLPFYGVPDAMLESEDGLLRWASGAAGFTWADPNRRRDDPSAPD